MLNILRFFDCSCFHRFFCHVRKLSSLFAVFLFLFCSCLLFFFFFCAIGFSRGSDGKIYLGTCYQLGLQDYVCVMAVGTIGFGGKDA